MSKLDYYVDDEPIDSDSSTPARINITNPLRQITFKRIKRGKRELSVPSYDPIDETEKKVNQALEEHRNDYLYNASSANTRASFLKSMKIIIEIILIVLGIIVGVLSLEKGNVAVIGKITSILGFVTSALVATKSLFNLEKRAVVLKSSANNLRLLANDLTLLSWKNIPVDKKLKILAGIEERAEEAKMAIFDMDVTSFKPKEKKLIDDNHSISEKTMNKMTIVKEENDKSEEV